MQSYMLTPKQAWRRSAFVFGSAAVVLGSYWYKAQYVTNKRSVFAVEYQMLKTNPKFYHNLHSQVADRRAAPTSVRQPRSFEAKQRRSSTSADR